MKPIPLIFPFFLATFALLFSTVFFPGLRILAFTPFFAIVYRRQSFISSLWIATLCGLLFDLISSHYHFGLYALISCVTTLLLYNQKRHFFDDKPLGLSLFTALISFVMALIQLLMLSAFGGSIHITGSVIFTDILLMSFVDALYAFLWFTCPLKGYAYIHYRLKRFGWKGLFFRGVKNENE